MHDRGDPPAHAPSAERGAASLASAPGNVDGRAARSPLTTAPAVTSFGSTRATPSDLTAVARPGSVPAPALFAWLGLAVATALVLLAIVLRDQSALDALDASARDEESATASASASEASGASSATPTREPPTSTRASSAELDHARSEGVAGLTALAQKFPADPAVLRALMLAHASDRSGYVAAVVTARRLIEVFPDAAASEDVRRVLQLAANGSPESASPAFELISAKMGAHGPELLYDMLGAPTSSKYAKDRATKLLDDPEVKQRAGAALLVLLELKASLPCARKALFARARDEGDARSLQYLKPLLATGGCGFFRNKDCFTCLGDRAELREAISAIEKRAPAH